MGVEILGMVTMGGGDYKGHGYGVVTIGVLVLGW